MFLMRRASNSQRALALPPKPKRRRTVLRLSLFLVALVSACVGTYIATNRETMVLDDETRATLGGTYAVLSDGVTHYRLEGPELGHRVVLLHGGTIPMLTWDALAPDLADSGFCVLRYDMYGRGLSDRPRVTYGRNLYVGQLKDLLDHLQWEKPVDVVGYSFGGAIATSFTAQYSDRVRRLVLISPLTQNYERPKFFLVPVLGEFLGRVFGSKEIERRGASEIQTDKFRGDLDLFRRQFRFEGFEQSVLSLFRSDALRDYTREYAALGSQKRDIMLLWGMEDQEITPPMIATVRRLVPSVEYHSMNGVGHGIVFQRPNEVYGLVNDFLKR